MWQFVVAALLAAQPQQSGTATGGVGQVVTEVRSQVAGVARARPESLELTLTSPVQLPSGRQLGASVRPAVSPEPWLVYSRGNLCQSVITHGPVPADATDGWRVTVTERSRTATQVMVTITWNRMWDRGRLITNGTGGTNELTLQRGDRIPLDMITRPAQPGVCGATTKSLEIHVGRPLLAAAVPAGESPLDGLVDAELWMVHQTPNGAETVERQTVRLVNGPMGFSFRTEPIETPDGAVYVELNGQLKAVQREDGSRGLWAGLTRSVIRQSTGATAFASPFETTAAWLGPNDVVSFDLPPLQFYANTGRALAGGGGRGGAIGATAGTGGTVSRGSQSGSGSGGTGAARGGGGVLVAPGGRAAPSGPNLLEGHKVSLRVRLNETR